MTATPSIIIHDVDLVQTDANSEEQGTLYVDLTIGDIDAVRVYRNFPVSLYEKWLNCDFGKDLYLSEIESAYPYAEEQDTE